MKPTHHSKVPPEMRLCILAREFRGTKDERERASTASKYAEAVMRLTNSKKTWRTTPTLKDRLPDKWMPEAFFEYWSLRPPV